MKKHKVMAALSILPEDLEIPKLHSYLLGAGPRPIAFASTMSEDGIANLAPFSFFNVLVQIRLF